MPSKNLTSAFFTLLLLTALSACHGHMMVKEDLVDSQESVTKSVTAFTDTVAADVTAHGIESWLKYFSKSSNFFMASEGERVFPNYDSASQEIKEKLSKQLVKIALNWSQLHIDSLSPVMVDFSSRYHEDLTNADGKVLATGGYVTGVIEKTAEGWKFRNLHWSTAH